MPTADELVKMAMQHVREPYDFGADVPLDKKNYSGPWDCAEFASWLVYQLTNRLMGCTNNSAPVNKAEPYSEGWARDGEKSGSTLTETQAANVRGAILVRKPRHGKPGHVSISRGDGTTIEAMDSANGVAVGKVLGRRWDVCFKVPGIDYP